MIQLAAVIEAPFQFIAYSAPSPSNLIRQCVCGGGGSNPNTNVTVTFLRANGEIGTNSYFVGSVSCSVGSFTTFSLVVIDDFFIKNVLLNNTVVFTP
jgi:hypothetical protein